MTKHGNYKLAEVELTYNDNLNTYSLWGRIGTLRTGVTKIRLQTLKPEQEADKEKYLEFWQKRIGLKQCEVELIQAGLNQDCEIRKA
jgi:hypothetical protein